MVVSLYLERTDEMIIAIHGFGESAFDSLPGKRKSHGHTTWKRMIMGDVEITFYLDGVLK